MQLPKVRLSQLFITLLLLSTTIVEAQKNKGKLFIIGGGKRSDILMNQMLKVADLKTKDFIVVLPMSSEEPDSAYIYFNKAYSELIKNKNKHQAAKCLINMGYISYYKGDWFGSQELNIEGIKLLNPQINKQEINRRYKLSEKIEKN